MINFDDIEQLSAIAKVVVEEGQISLIINGYRFDFTIHEYSNKITKVYFDDYNKLKARKMLIELGVVFKKETKDEVHHNELVDYIQEIYRKSNYLGGYMCSWTNHDITDYKEF